MRRKPRPSLQLVYRALFEISTMRGDVAAFGDDMPDAEAVRLGARLDFAEGLAVRLLDTLESRSGVVAH